MCKKCVLKSENPLLFSEQGSSVYVVNLKSGDVRTANAPDVFALHHVNAYEEDDGNGDVKILMDVCTIDPNNIGRTTHRLHLQNTFSVR